MTLPTRNLSYLLVLAVFASSLFGLSAATEESADRCAHLGPRVGASQTEYTEVGYCEPGRLDMIRGGIALRSPLMTGGSPDRSAP